jgi:hypothetical protein
MLTNALAHKQKQGNIIRCKQMQAYEKKHKQMQGNAISGGWGGGMEVLKLFYGQLAAVKNSHKLRTGTIS